MTLAAIANQNMSAGVQKTADPHLAFLSSDQRLPIAPNDLAASATGIVVAGSSGTAAWAAKTDLQGKSLWSYTQERPPGRDADPFLRAVQVEFACAMIDADEGVWLAGSTVVERRQAGLLVHLTKDGSPTDRRTLFPNDAGSLNAPRNSFSACAKTAGGWVFVGKTYTAAASNEARAVATNQVDSSPWHLAYWVLMLDGSGQPLREAIIPSSLVGVATKDLTLRVIGSDVVLAASSGLDRSEIVRLDANGRIQIRKVFEHAFYRLARTLGTDEHIVLCGNVFHLDPNQRSKVESKPVLLTLDTKLQELARRELPETLLPKLTYELADHSLVVFGSEVHSVGEQFVSTAVHWTPGGNMWQPQSSDRHLFSDVGYIDTAANLGATGRFVAATVAVAKGFPDHLVPNEHSPGFSRGAALEFFDF
jgi:hypothetical protein